MRNSWGWLPKLMLTGSFSLLLVAYAYSGARAAAVWAEPLFWAGLIVLIVPITARVASVEATRQERIALVVWLGLAFYLVKVMHNPFAFTFPDELSHLRNVNEILQNGRLFEENPVIPATALYPGLQIITSTLVSLSGLSIFGAGTIVIGAARLVLFLALYFLYEQVSGSARVAGIATVFYMANTSFLFWTAQYAYESLALPIAVFVLFVIARRESISAGSQRTGLAAIGLLGVVSVVITHHMTSYALAAILTVLTLFSIISSRGKNLGPWALALVACAATLMWLVFVATLTIDYLSPVLLGAIKSILRLIAGEESTRQLFKSSSTGAVAPLWEQWVAIGSVMLIALGLPFGLWQIWKQYRQRLLALLLAGVAPAYFLMQAFRLTPAGWETSNRASEFLFVGIAFVLAVGTVQCWFSRRCNWIDRWVLAGCVVILIFGGFIAGWPPKARLPRPYVVAVGSQVVEPQGVSTSKWMLAFLGRDNRVAVDASNAKLIGAYGEQHPFTSRKHGIQAMFFSDNIGRTERNIIRKTGVRYVVVDRRLISWDHMVGYYFDPVTDGPNAEFELVEPAVYGKFDSHENVSKIFDSGNIFIYDVSVFNEVSSTR